MQSKETEEGLLDGPVCSVILEYELIVPHVFRQLFIRNQTLPFNLVIVAVGTFVIGAAVFHPHCCPFLSFVQDLGSEQCAKVCLRLYNQAWELWLQNVVERSMMQPRVK